jgi:hypothetical protein
MKLGICGLATGGACRFGFRPMLGVSIHSGQSVLDVSRDARHAMFRHLAVVLRRLLEPSAGGILESRIGRGRRGANPPHNHTADLGELYKYKLPW